VAIIGWLFGIGMILGTNMGENKMVAPLRARRRAGSKKRVSRQIVIPKVIPLLSKTLKDDPAVK
jgi:hypothetical protein